MISFLDNIGLNPLLIKFVTLIVPGRCNLVQIYLDQSSMFTMYRHLHISQVS